MVLVIFSEEALIAHFSLSSLLLRSSSCSSGGSHFRRLLPHLFLAPARRFRISFNLAIPAGKSLVATTQPWINSASSIPRLSAVIYVQETEFASQMKGLPSVESFNWIFFSCILVLYSWDVSIHLQLDSLHCHWLTSQ